MQNNLYQNKMNIKLIRYSLRAVLCLLSVAFGLHTVEAQHTLEQDFKKPRIDYRPIPFWHLNGKLTPEGIKKQVADAGKSGFGGVAVLPVTPGPQVGTNLTSPGMSPMYLSDEYFKRYADILKAARDNGLHVILYDDIDFPSGTAGGKLKQLYPDAIRKEIVKTDTTISGPVTFRFTLPGGKLMAAVGVEDGTEERKNLTGFAHSNQFEWKIPEGKWHLMFFTCQNGPDAIVDYLDDASVKKFVSLTYDEYAKRFSNYFGSVIKQTFFDDVGYVTKERGWTDGLNEKFQQLYGKDPVLYYPALWQDIGPETEAARVAFYDTRAELLAEGFPKVIADWDQQHGLKSSGHPPGNYEIQPVDMCFDVIKFYRHEHIPTMDAIFYHGHGRDGFKMVSSAAAVYDRPVTASETFGAFSEQTFDANMMYRTAMEIFARGINYLIPHGMWYDPDAKAVRIPPLISPYSAKIASALNSFNDFAARTSMMLQGGRTVSEIGVIYPIASLEGFYHFQAADNKSVGQYAPPGTDYLVISSMLTNQIHRDFTFIHPQLFVKDQYVIRNHEVVMNNIVNMQKYNIIIVPAGRVISAQTLKKLKLFYDNGGKIIATGILPTKSAEFGEDAAVVALVDKIFGNQSKTASANGIIMHSNNHGGMAAFIPELSEKVLNETLGRMNATPDVLIENNPQPKSANGGFSYLHKVKAGKNIYYFANSTDDQINTYLNLKGRLKPELWDPNDGGISKINDVHYINIHGQSYTRIKFSLKAVKSIFIVSKL